MHAENLVIYKSSYGQAVEAVSEDFPELDGVASFAFIIETINTVDGCTFVVTSE